MPDVSAFAEEWRKYINTTSRILRPELIKALKPTFPTFSVDVTGVEVPTVSVNMPASNSEANDWIPTFDLSQLPTDKNGQPTFDASHLGLPNVQQIVKAFDVKQHLENMGLSTDPKIINEVRHMAALRGGGPGARVLVEGSVYTQQAAAPRAGKCTTRVPRLPAAGGAWGCRAVCHALAPTYIRGPALTIHHPPTPTSKPPRASTTSTASCRMST